MKAAIYVRVSTDEQDTDAQLPELLELCRTRGWSPDVRRETASGAKARPVLDELLDDARRGRVGAVAVWALDRIGRDLWDIIGRVRALAACNVRLVSLREPWLDTDGSVRELLLMIFAWVAEHERQRLRERTRAGVAKARAAGKRIGRPRVGEAQLAAAVAECVELPQGWQGGSAVGRDPGSVREVARRHGIGEGTLRRALAAARAKMGARKTGSGSL